MNEVEVSLKNLHLNYHHIYKEDLMNKFFLLSSILIVIPILLFGQTSPVVQDFDTELDTSYFREEISENADSTLSYINWGLETTDTKFGDGALSYEYSAHNIESWGGYAKIEHMAPDSQVYNWTGWDSISFWYNNVTPASIASRVHIRFEVYDVSDVPDTTSNAGDMEFFYSFQYILDDAPGWKEFKIKLEETDAMDGSTFNLLDWAGKQDGNGLLDLDKIKGWAFEVSVSGGGDGDHVSGKIIFDQIELKSYSGKSLVIFNGKNIPPAIDAGKFTWGSEVLDVLEGGGADPKTNAMRFVEADGWTGAGFNIPSTDLSKEWMSDSLKFKMKADVGTGSMRVQFEAGPGKVGKSFSPVADDGEWHDYVFALQDMVYQDGTADFDTTDITVFQFMEEGTGSAGRTILFDYMWTDNPIIDVTPPDPPTNVQAIPNTSEYYNVVAWTDVPGEEGEVYNVYASESVITDINALGVETVALGVEETVQGANHYLRYPLKEHEVKYYYAVTCVDASGNVSEPGIDDIGATNTARGVPTISMNPPGDFVADGDVSEWISAGIEPLVLKPSTNKIGVGAFDNDKDFTATIYMAVDNDYLYVALDMIDNEYISGGTAEWWKDDAAEMFIGLYNQTKQHSGYQDGEEPDYQMHLRYDGFYVERHDLPKFYEAGSSNYSFVNYIGDSWGVELKLSLDTLAQKTEDDRFVPENGMKIPLDFSLHDSDILNTRDGMLAFSEANDDASYNGAQYWFYTWIGDTNKVTTAIEDNTEAGIVGNYRLNQNYPNPFNPSTTIEYFLPKSSQVNISVYNVLGQKVTTLLNTRQSAGEQRIEFNASDLSSGVYFYKLQADDFVQVNKMLLMK
jgi:hypothetical protein